MRRVKSEDNVADLDNKALSNAVIEALRHVGYVNMDAEEVEGAQQDVAMFSGFGSGPEARDGSQNAARDRAKQQRQQRWAQRDHDDRHFLKKRVASIRSLITVVGWTTQLCTNTRI